MAAGGAGYYHTNFFHDNFWHDDYWADQASAPVTGPPVGSLSMMGCGRVLVWFVLKLIMTGYGSAYT